MVVNFGLYMQKIPLVVKISTHLKSHTHMMYIGFSIHSQIIICNFYEFLKRSRLNDNHMIFLVMPTTNPTLTVFMRFANFLERCRPTSPTPLGVFMRLCLFSIRELTNPTAIGVYDLQILERSHCGVTRDPTPIMTKADLEKDTVVEDEAVEIISTGVCFNGHSNDDCSTSTVTAMAWQPPVLEIHDDGLEAEIVSRAFREFNIF